MSLKPTVKPPSSTPSLTKFSVNHHPLLEMLTDLPVFTACIDLSSKRWNRHIFRNATDLMTEGTNLMFDNLFTPLALQHLNSYRLLHQISPSTEIQGPSLPILHPERKGSVCCRPISSLACPAVVAPNARPYIAL